MIRSYYLQYLWAAFAIPVIIILNMSIMKRKIREWSSLIIWKEIINESKTNRLQLFLQKFLEILLKIPARQRQAQVPETHQAGIDQQRTENPTIHNQRNPQADQSVLQKTDRPFAIVGTRHKVSRDEQEQAHKVGIVDRSEPFTQHASDYVLAALFIAVEPVNKKK